MTFILYHYSNEIVYCLWVCVFCIVYGCVYFVLFMGVCILYCLWVFCVFVVCYKYTVYSSG